MAWILLRPSNYKQMAPLVRTGGSRHTGLAALPHRNIHSAKGFRKDASLFSNAIPVGRSHDKCRISNVERKGSVIEKQGFGSTGSSTNKEVQNTVDLKKNSMKLWQDKNFGLSIEFPLDSISKSCVCPRGTADRMKAENRSPISSTFRGGRGCGDGDSERFVGKT